MRRLAWVLAVPILLTGLPLAVARGAEAPDPVPLRLDVTGWQRTALPLPGEGDGIGPGSYLLITIDGPDELDDGTFVCSGNFVWRDGGNTYLGAAGHCFLPVSQTKAVGSNPWVTRVEVCIRSCLFGGLLGAVVNGEFADLGPVVYARQSAEGDADAEIGHDFGLVTIPAALSSLVRPHMPVWGGPTGVAEAGGLVCMYGNGLVAGETFATKARIGTGLISFTEEGFSAEIPINGGDSGSAVNRCDGGAGAGAVGLITHGLGVSAVPTAVAFGTTVAEAKAMVQADWGRTIDVVLAA